MNRSLCATLCLALLFSGCPKKPSPAGVALATLTEEIARGHNSAAGTTLAWGSRMVEKCDGDLTEHLVQAFPKFNIGVYDWSKTAIMKDELLETGAHRVELALDVCLRSEDGGGCSRPSTYTFVAEVVNDEGTWKVESASCAEKNMVR